MTPSCMARGGIKSENSLLDSGILIGGAGTVNVVRFELKKFCGIQAIGYCTNRV